jgi:hypothetical protein
LCDRLLANLPLAVPALPPLVIPAKIAVTASPMNWRLGSADFIGYAGRTGLRNNALVGAQQSEGNA